MNDKLEMAPVPVPFLEGEFFAGLCEIAVACATDTKLYIPAETKGIFDSLYFKRVFARMENEDGSYSVGDFQMKNRYLYNYDRNARVYTDKKDANFEAFLAKVKDIVDNNNYTVFSTTPVAVAEETFDIRTLLTSPNN